MISFPDEVWKGIELFNRQKFFDAHESLENAWRAEPDPIRSLYQGILQVGVAYYHLEHRNLIGAQKSFRFARRNLVPFLDQPLPIDLPDLFAQIDLTEAAILRATNSKTSPLPFACPIIRRFPMD